MKTMNTSSNITSQKRHLLEKIRKYDFAIVETSLFLNTHPNNLKALQYYTKIRKERDLVASEYEKNFGPLTIKGNIRENNWDWISGPWPWEGDC